MASKIQPMDCQGGGKGKLVALVGTAAAGLMIATVGLWEGKSNDPYKDIVGVWTVCYGETRVAMRPYTDAQCEDMLAKGLADFAKPVLDRNPELKGRPNQLAAATSLTYNIGAGNYWKSTVAARFSAGNFKGACDAFLNWNRATYSKPQTGRNCIKKKAGGWACVVNGLDRRRQYERTMCLKGL